MIDMKTLTISMDALTRAALRGLPAPAALPTPTPAAAPATSDAPPRRWPEHRRCETQCRREILERHPEIMAGVRLGHDGGDEDDGEGDARRRIRGWACDMLDAAVGV